MDHQGVVDRPWRISGQFFQHIPFDQAQSLFAKWLNPRTANCGKADLALIEKNVIQAEWDLWRLLPPAEGVAVTYPEKGQLFIHYLRGKGLFGNVNKEILLSAARDEGLSGMSAEVRSEAHVRILRSLDFEIKEYLSLLNVWKMELTDG